MSEENEYFWLKPPWSILIDILRVSKINPWSIELDHLIQDFLNKMLALNLVNLKVSGLALLSAAIIHRLKTELALKSDDEDEEKEEEPEEKTSLKLLPPIMPPFRQISKKVSLKELLIALERALEQELTAKKKTPKKLNVPEIESLMYAIDTDRTEIERKISNIYEQIKNLSKNEEIIRFSQILPTHYSKIEKVRILFCVLQLGCRNKIDVWQEEPFGEIFIKLLN
ncbi:MAG: segregation/condensation protein A [Candidatus Odinarchaeia archaeon]